MPGRERRLIVTGLVALAHLGLLAAMGASLRVAPRPSERPAVAVSLHDGLSLAPMPVGAEPETLLAVVEPVAAETLPPPPPESVIIDPRLPSVDLERDPDDVGEVGEAPATAVAALSAASGATCELAESLRATLQTDAAVQGGLARVPRTARSVAGAIMLWDGRWVSAGAVDPQALAPIRRAITDVVRAASTECLETANQGPLLIPVAGVADTTILTIGSGVWRWSDLLPPA